MKNFQLKYKLEPLQKLYSQIENLLAATETKNWGKSMKYLIYGLKSTDEIKKVLNNCIDSSSYDHKTLASKLSRLYPRDGWSERTINYMLAEAPQGSQSIDSAKMNQLLDFLYPEEKFEFTVDSFYEKLEGIYERLSNLRTEFTKSVKTDKVVDEKESMLIQANIRMISHMVVKFEESMLKAINVTLG